MKTMTKEFNMLISGVGGQGVILMSELLGEAAVRDKLRVRGSEILGMAVRGGSVTSAIRLGEDVYGPLIPMGKCSALVGMEPSEALRNITCLSSSSLVLLNTAATVPFTVPLGQTSYPSLETILEKLKKATEKLVQLDAARLAKEAGSHLATNVVMLGALFGTERLPIKLATIRKVIEERFPAKAAPVNIKAFELGYEACKQALN
jgi:indolepyruvate ferredoxin oxidoreductase beta subunit